MSLVGFTLLGSIEAPSLTGSASDVPLLVKPNTEFTVAMLASLDVGGGDLRFSSDAAGTTQLACEIVDGLDVVWVSTAGLSVATSLTIYVWGDNTGASQPAAGAAFGRNAVWVGSAISSHLTESSGTVATDSAGNRDGTYNGALPTVGADFGQDFNGATDYVNYGNAALGIASAFTFSLKIKPDTIAGEQQLFAADDTSGTGGTRNWQWRLTASGQIRIIAFDNANSIIINTLGTLVLSAATEYIVNFVWDGAAYKSYINGSQDSSTASTTNIGDLSGVGFGAAIGARQSATIQEYFNGQAGDLDVIAGAFKTADQISIEYDNQSATGSWWIAEDAGGGGETLLVDSGLYSVAGTDVSLKASYKTQADSGSFTLTGTALGLITGYKTLAESGTYTLTGTEIQVRAAYNEIAQSGAYDLTGTDVTLIYTPSAPGQTLVIDSGAYTLTGTTTPLKAQFNTVTDSGNYSLTGTDVQLRFGSNMILDSGSYALTGQSIGLIADYGIIAGIGAYTLTGTALTLIWSGDSAQTIGEVTAGFADSGITTEYKPTQITVTFKGL